jgi:predicted RNA-binding Zn-ribbon protein involved in translation (DUF1610 family)
MSGLADAPPFPFLRCEKCREHLDEGDLFCPSCGHEAPLSGKNQEHEPAERIQVHRFECTGCGASLTWELEAQGLRCAFCGRETLEERETVSVPPPRLIVPFQIDRTRAETIFRESVGRGIFRPGDLLRELAVKEMRGVYLPYWSFSADCHLYWTADSDATPLGAKAEWAPRFGEHEACYEHVLIPASGALTSYEIGKLGAWDLDQAVPHAPELVRDIPTEAFSVTRKRARVQALEQLGRNVRADCNPKIPGIRRRNVKINPLYTSTQAWPLLVPVWILAYEYRGRRYRFLINGQTGKIEGSAPVSPWRLLAAVALVVLAFLLLVLLSGK